MLTLDAHTRFKLPNRKPANSILLVPGAGLEPARTLPGPRDFKSILTLAQQRLRESNPRQFRDLLTSACSCLFVPFGGLGTERAQCFPTPRMGSNSFQAGPPSAFPPPKIFSHRVNRWISQTLSLLRR